MRKQKYIVNHVPKEASKKTYSSGFLSCISSDDDIETCSSQKQVPFWQIFSLSLGLTQLIRVKTRWNFWQFMHRIFVYWRHRPVCWPTGQSQLTKLILANYIGQYQLASILANFNWRHRPSLARDSVGLKTGVYKEFLWREDRILWERNLNMKKTTIFKKFPSLTERGVEEVATPFIYLIISVRYKFQSYSLLSIVKSLFFNLISDCF